MKTVDAKENISLPLTPSIACFETANTKMKPSECTDSLCG